MRQKRDQERVRKEHEERFRQLLSRPRGKRRCEECEEMQDYEEFRFHDDMCRHCRHRELFAEERRRERLREMGIRPLF